MKKEYLVRVPVIGYVDFTIDAESAESAREQVLSQAEGKYYMFWDQYRLQPESHIMVEEIMIVENIKESFYNRIEEVEVICLDKQE